MLLQTPPFELELSLADGPLERGWPAIERFLEAGGLAPRIQFVAGLVFEETVTNILRHTAAGQCSVVRVVLEPDQETLRMAILDDGPPFNPCAAQAEAPAGASELSDGGRGILLMRSMCRSMHYRRDHDWNRLEVLITAQP